MSEEVDPNRPRQLIIQNEIKIIFSLPGGKRVAESDDVICRCAGEGTGSIVISVAISAWARTLENLRVQAGFTSIRSAIGPTATILWVPEGFARALTRHALVAVHHLKLGRTSGVQVHSAPGGRAVPSGSSFSHHRHWQIITVHQADVIEIEPISSIQSKLGQSCRRRCSCSGAFDGGRAAVCGDARELSGGVFGA